MKLAKYTYSRPVFLQKGRAHLKQNIKIGDWSIINLVEHFSLARTQHLRPAGIKKSLSTESLHIEKPATHQVLQYFEEITSITTEENWEMSQDNNIKC